MESDQSARVLSLLSHELRGPVGVIRGYLRLLEQTGAELSDQHRQAVSAALRASDRAADLLTQASMLAQLQRDETPLVFAPVAFNALLESAAAGVQLPDTPAVRLDVQNTVAGATIAADANLLRGALTTVIAAVVRAQPRDATVYVSTRPQPQAGADGIAIAVATVRSLDGLIDQPIEIMRGGMGLELPIAQHLIAAHHGDLRGLADGDRAAGMLVWLPSTT